MNILVTLLLVASVVCFLLTMFGATRPKVDLVAAGLLFWVLTALLPRIIT